MWSAASQVRRHVVQLAELLSEPDVALVVEAGVTEDADAILAGNIVSKMTVSKRG